MISNNGTTVGSVLISTLNSAREAKILHFMLNPIPTPIEIEKVAYSPPLELNDVENVRYIERVVCEHFGINKMKRTRQRKYAMARQIIFSLLRERTDLSYLKIAKIFGYNHATVIHGYKLVQDLRRYDKEFGRLYRDIENKIDQL